MCLPLEDACAGSGCFCFGNVSGLLKRDGERGVRERVVGRERGERQGGGDRRLKASGVAQGSNESVMGFEVVGIGCDGRAIGFDGERRMAGRELIHCTLAEFFGGCILFTHDIRIKADAIAAEGVLRCRLGR